MNPSFIKCKEGTAVVVVVFLPSCFVDGDLFKERTKTFVH